MNCGQVEKPMIVLCAKHWKTRKAAAKRVLKAETLLYRAGELLAKAQGQLAVITGGLNQNYAKIGTIRDKVKDQMYDLERCRESGYCDLDETAAAMMSKKPKRKKA